MPQDLRPSLFPSSSDFPEETSMGIWEVLRCCHDKPVEKSVRKWIILCLMKGLKGAPYIVQRPLWLGIGNTEYGVYAPSESSIWPISWKKLWGLWRNPVYNQLTKAVSQHTCISSWGCCFACSAAVSQDHSSATRLLHTPATLRI